MVQIEASKLFASLSAVDLASLKREAQEKNFAPGEVLFKEGDAGDGLYVVASGTVQISALLGNNERRVLTRNNPGDFFGEMALLDGAPRSATATAETATRVHFIPRDVLLNLLDHAPRLAVSLMREISARIRDTNRQYIEEVLQAERLTLVGRFARSIVHDFKNPLNVIGLSAEMAGMDSATPQMRKNAAERIRKQVDRLGNMINELLEFTRGSQTSSVLAQSNYCHYVNQIIEDLRAEVAEKKVEIIFQNELPDVDVLIDTHRLVHVFYNLIHNAVDAMPEGGTIFMNFEVGPEYVTTFIEDTGKGFAPEIKGRLFEAFATYGKAQGTGLGLSICKKIIHDHRGTIQAHSYPGRGAVFSFTLPLKQ
ncbi:MAG: cyclic nucleotide-binding domain-containing protein [Verrucomicrobiota bacterium]|nr:cyclic nucleotide-binding domain-containing protein [Verrucomicrobiota bacterium]